MECLILFRGWVLKKRSITVTLLSFYDISWVLMIIILPSTSWKFQVQNFLNFFISTMFWLTFIPFSNRLLPIFETSKNFTQHSEGLCFNRKRKTNNLTFWSLQCVLIILLTHSFLKTFSVFRKKTFLIFLRYSILKNILENRRFRVARTSKVWQVR